MQPHANPKLPLSFQYEAFFSEFGLETFPEVSVFPVLREQYSPCPPLESILVNSKACLKERVALCKINPCHVGACLLVRSYKGKENTFEREGEMKRDECTGEQIYLCSIQYCTSQIHPWSNVAQKACLSDWLWNGVFCVVRGFCYTKLSVVNSAFFISIPQQNCVRRRTLGINISNNKWKHWHLAFRFFSDK